LRAKIQNDDLFQHPQKFRGAEIFCERKMPDCLACFLHQNSRVFVRAILPIKVKEISSHT